MPSDQRYAPFQVIVVTWPKRNHMPTGTQLELIRRVTYRPGYRLVVHTDGARAYVQVQCWRADTYTGQWAWGSGGKGWLSPHMAPNELVQLVFGLFKAYEEHEVREWFRWEGRAVFGPHVALDAAWQAAAVTEYRTSPARSCREGEHQWTGEVVASQVRPSITLWRCTVCGEIR